MDASLRAWHESWLEEKRSVYLYRVLAKSEANPATAKMFSQLAERADAQAKVWAEKIRAKDSSFSDSYFPEGRVRMVAFLARRFGARRMKSALAALKVRGLSALQEAPVLGPHAMPQTVQDIGRRHQLKGSSGNIRAAVFGVNDGLVSTASLILGVAAAASLDTRMILISATAGLFAGALSMASGEYVSVRSQRELLEYQLALEKAELEVYPEEEAEELALIYAARGVPPEQAHEIAQRMISDPERALMTLAREELGMDPDDLGSPFGAAISSFIAFSIGGFLPLLPFILSSSKSMLSVSMGITGVSLFATGAMVSLFSGKSLWWSGLRMLTIGGGAGVLSFLIGSAFV